MREILAKNITSRDKKKKDILISEIIERDNLVAKLQKRSLYFIREIIEVEDPQEARALLESRTKGLNSKPRHTYIMKLHNTKEAKDIVLYKTIGDLYAVLENKIYFIKLLHYTRIEFTKRKQAV